MFMIATTSWPDSEDGVTVFEVVSDKAKSDPDKAWERALVLAASACEGDDPDVGDCAEFLGSGSPEAEEILTRCGLKSVDIPFVVVEKSGYDRPLERWAAATDIDQEIRVDENGLNEKIGFHVLDEASMAHAGFRRTVGDPDRWYLCQALGNDITLNVTVPENGSRGRIDVLDEAFCQPYDYQLILAKNPRHPIANKVRDQVEAHIAKLQELGIISGHVRGEYI